MANVKVVNTNLDQNLNGTYFTNIASETIFQFGSFVVTTNFQGRKYIDYTNTLSTFVHPVTLDTIGLNTTQSSVLYEYQTNVVLNLDDTNLNTFVKFGSAYEFLRVSVQEIILGYPASLYVSSTVAPGGNITYFDFTYDATTDTASFKVPIAFIENTFGLVYIMGSTSKPNDIALRNLNLSYQDYVIWSTSDSNNTYPLISFSGYSTGVPFIYVKTFGNPFKFMNSGATTGYVNFHIKPNNFIFEEYRTLLSDYEKYMVSERDGTNGFVFTLNDPTLLNNGGISYVATTMLWPTTDGYNIDINTTPYQTFLTTLLTIGGKYDSIKTDLIARFLTTTSLKTYDLTQEGKMTKLLRVYGWEFDQLKKFIDSLVNINTVTYNKVNNIPDQLVINLARTFGWNYFELVNEAELMTNIFNINDTERNLNTDLLPAEVNIELWRRILINANYFWKAKGTRQAIKAMFLMIGIPEPFINITEYVYTVNGRINPNTVSLSPSDFPNSSLPYDNQGYPKAPLESNAFFFQISGDTDSGQAYMNNFRNAGFNLTRTVDNKKSWIQTGVTFRVHNDTPQYFQLDSKLVLNTKEVDVSLDTAQGIEYDVYDYIKNIDYPANSSGYTLPYTYVNISLGVSGSQNTFTLPSPYNKAQGDLEVRFNGILLNAPKEYSGGTPYTKLAGADYTVSGNQFTLTNSNYALNNGTQRDVVEATYIYSGTTQNQPISGVTVKYMVTRIKPSVVHTVIPLPNAPNGDVQVTINGIALTKGTPQYIADYIVDPNNPSQIIIQNPDVIGYLTTMNQSTTNAFIQVAYITVTGSTSVAARSEILRVDSYNSTKLYYNSSANKFVYTLNYKMKNASDVKFLIDGIALEPGTDYTINVQNPYQVYLPKGIKYGSVISAYYIVAGNDYFNPIIAAEYGLGDISKMTFLEFIEFIQRRLINARNRKTISDFMGGWYPTLLSVYIQYLDRGLLPANNPLHSNGYTFANLYPFLSKYNAFFQKFVDELLAATIIIRKGGLLIRNTVFTKQKFMYKRGVNFDPNINYLGDDGSQFLVEQVIPPPPPPPPTLFVQTVSGTSNIHQITATGGKNILGYNVLTTYGMQYRSGTTGNWIQSLQVGSLAVNHFSSTLSGLKPNTSYQYRAVINSNIYSYTGNTLTIKTLPIPVTPYIETKSGTAGITTINNTGGQNIVDYANATYYGMQYRSIGTKTYDIKVTPLTLNYASGSTTQSVTITGDTFNSFAISTADSWVHPSATPTSATPAGVLSQIGVDANTGAARTGYTCYTPYQGTMKTVTIKQASGTVPPTSNIVYMPLSTGGDSSLTTMLCCGAIGTTSPMGANDKYNIKISWNMGHEQFTEQLYNCVAIFCNNTVTPLYSCVWYVKTVLNNTGNFPVMQVKHGDIIGVFACAETMNNKKSYSTISINTVTPLTDNFVKGDNITYNTSLTASLNYYV